MNQTQKILSELLKAALFGQPAQLPDEVDWNVLMEEAKAQTVLPLVAAALPKEQAPLWEIAAAQSKAHFMRALYEQTKAVALLQREKIPFVILKGSAAAVYYPTPSLRTTWDVDLLVAEGYFEKAFAVFEENGYSFKECYEDERDYTFLKGGVVFELHKHYSDIGHDIESYLQKGIDNAETLTLYGNAFPVLPKAENGLVLLDHIRHHLLGGLGIRQIIDFMMFVHSVSDDKTFEEEFLPLLETAGLGTFARVITKMCKRQFGLPTPAAWCESADDKTCDELLERLFLKGNFGRKDPYEYRPMKSFSMSVKEEGLFRALQKAGLANSKACREHKILRPFAWLYQLLRYFGRGIAALFHGEKLGRDIEAGKDEADFFGRLGIY